MRKALQFYDQKSDIRHGRKADIDDDDNMEQQEFIDPYSALCGDTGAESVVDTPDALPDFGLVNYLIASLHAMISKNQDEFYEYQQRGHNILFPKQIDIDALKKQVSLLPDDYNNLRQPADAFLEQFGQFRHRNSLYSHRDNNIESNHNRPGYGERERERRANKEAIRQSNHLCTILLETVMLTRLLRENDIHLTPWGFFRTEKEEMLRRALFQMDEESHRQDSAGGDKNGYQDDTVREKLNAVVDSATGEEWLTRITVVTQINAAVNRLQYGIKRVSRYAQKRVRAKDETGNLAGYIKILAVSLHAMLTVILNQAQAAQPADRKLTLPKRMVAEKSINALCKNNFSHKGMLAKRVAEWQADEAQRYLDTISSGIQESTTVSREMNKQGKESPIAKLQERIWRRWSKLDHNNSNVESRQDRSNSQQSTPQKREPILGKISDKDLSPNAKKLSEVTASLLKSGMGAEYTAYITKPKENCANAANQVKRILNSNNYIDIKVVELGIWVNGGEGTIPINHYVVMAKKEGVDITVDLTAGQFELYGFTDPIIDTKNNWIHQWQQAVKDKPRTLIKMVSVTGSLDTSPFSSFSDANNVWRTVPNGELLQSPGWYQNTNKES